MEINATEIRAFLAAFEAPPLGTVAWIQKSRQEDVDRLLKHICKVGLRLLLIHTTWIWLTCVLLFDNSRELPTRCWHPFSVCGGANTQQQRHLRRRGQGLAYTRFSSSLT